MMATRVACAEFRLRDLVLVVGAEEGVERESNRLVEETEEAMRDHLLLMAHRGGGTKSHPLGDATTQDERPATSDTQHAHQSFPRS